MYKELGDRKPSQYLRHLQSLAVHQITQFGSVASLQISRPSFLLNPLQVWKSQLTLPIGRFRDRSQSSHGGYPTCRYHSKCGARLTSALSLATLASRKTQKAVGNSFYRLFITDRKSRIQFLIHTGSDEYNSLFLGRNMQYAITTKRSLYKLSKNGPETADKGVSTFGVLLSMVVRRGQCQREIGKDWKHLRVVKSICKFHTKQIPLLILRTQNENLSIQVTAKICTIQEQVRTWSSNKKINTASPKV